MTWVGSWPCSSAADIVGKGSRALQFLSTWHDLSHLRRGSLKWGIASIRLCRHICGVFSINGWWGRSRTTIGDAACLTLETPWPRQTQVSLCSLGWHGAQAVDQASFELSSTEIKGVRYHTHLAWMSMNNVDNLFGRLWVNFFEFFFKSEGPI